MGVIDILVNNAGIIKRIPMHEMTAAEFRQVIDIDPQRPLHRGIEGRDPLHDQEGPRQDHQHICSMMSELGRETVSAYAAAKGGLKDADPQHLLGVRRVQHPVQRHRPEGLHIATPQTAPLRERQADGSRHPFDSFIVAKTPACPLGNARGSDEVMGPAVFLASDASNFVNGHVLLRRRRYSGLHRQAAAVQPTADCRYANARDHPLAFFVSVR